MKITKKNLLSLIQENLNEMPLDYTKPNPRYNPNAQPGEPGYGEPERTEIPDRPHSDVTRGFETGETPFKKAFTPRLQELLASKRYHEVVSKVKKITGTPESTPLQNVHGSLNADMMSAVNEIERLERPHLEKLQKIAITLTCKLLGVDKNEYIWDAKIVPLGGINTQGTAQANRGENNPQQVNPEIEDENLDDWTEEEARNEVQNYNNLLNFNLERAKRRIINGLTQGQAKKGHWYYEEIPNVIKRVTGSDRLFNLYGLMMSTNDTNYWQVSNSMVKSMEGLPAGKVDVIPPAKQTNDDDEDTDYPPDMGNDDDDDYDNDEQGNEQQHEAEDRFKIVATGINFITLLHELNKGVMEVASYHGLPKDDNLSKQVADAEDIIDHEAWDIRLGPALLDKFNEKLPTYMFEDKKFRYIRMWVLAKIYQLPARDFLILTKEVVEDTPRGQRMLDDIVTAVINYLNGEHAEETAAYERYMNQLNQASQETTDDELSSWTIDDLGFDFGNDIDDDSDDGDEPIRR